jgi:RNase H-like domain found in reverse transcriptase/Integrase zinc binding domain
MNYYRRFIKIFSEIARPLHKLTRNAEWEWTEEQQRAFDELKEEFSGEEILHMPMDQGKFILEVDALNYATGAVLSQLQEEKKQLIDTDSKSMNGAERNYLIYDKEMLAVMRAVKKWRHLLLGAEEPFDILSDHQNLTYYQQPQNLTRRQARWAAILSKYDFKMKHVKGKTNGKADALSRRDDHDQGKEDNKDITMLQDAWFHAMVIEQSDLYSRIAEAMKNHSTIEQCAQKQGEEWKENEDGMREFREIVYVPKNKKLQDEIIELHHDQPIMGHSGPERTKDLIQRGFWWPRMQDDITNYC